MPWLLAHSRSIDLSRAAVMGILNLTPDSFSDGGAYPTPAAAVEAARRMADEGAAIIDVGGESTRPGSQRVSAAEQLRRVLPVIRAIRASRDLDHVALSIDTTLDQVAREAIAAGADIINDVSAGQESPALFALAASSRAGLILMHRLRPPDADRYSDQYDAPQPPSPTPSLSAVPCPLPPSPLPPSSDITLHVRDFLHARARAALDTGLPRESIVLDPGLGFGKTVAQNLELIARTRELATPDSSPPASASSSSHSPFATPHSPQPTPHSAVPHSPPPFPILSAASRKSFVGRISLQRDSTPGEREPGSLAVTVAHRLAGASIFRVHDVAPHLRALRIADAILAAPSPRSAL